MTKRISYTGLVLDENSRTNLLAAFSQQIPPEFEVIAHHMTINMGSCESGPAAGILNQEGTLTVVGFAKDEKVIAVKVKTNIPSANAIKHITLAVNRTAGGKPFHSNQLTNWEATESLTLKGVVAEC